jgi:polysaccharide pyruvyl transferase WcaK-like protein
MSTALLRGYYGRGNAGDDALLLVSVWAVREMWHVRRVLASASQLPWLPGNGVRAMYFDPELRGATRLNRLIEWAAPRLSDLVIFGGGSTWHTGHSIAQFRRWVRAAGPGPHFAAGIGVGPFRDATAETECRELLRELHFTGVRDRFSYERARALAPDARVELTFDVAALLPAAGGLDPLPWHRTQRSALGIALCNDGPLPGGQVRQARRLEQLATAVEQLLRQVAIDEIVLLDFDGHPTRGDAVPHLAFARRLGDAVKCRHVPYAGDPVGLLRAISGLSGLVAMRLHAAVFAYLARTPTLILSYHEKCLGWAEMIGAPPGSVFDANGFDASEVAAGMSRLLTRPAWPVLPPAEARRRSLRNWAWSRESEVPPEPVGAFALPDLVQRHAGGGDPEVPVAVQHVSPHDRSRTGNPCDEPACSSEQ